MVDETRTLQCDRIELTNSNNNSLAVLFNVHVTYVSNPPAQPS